MNTGKWSKFLGGLVKKEMGRDLQKHLTQVRQAVVETKGQTKLPFICFVRLEDHSF